MNIPTIEMPREVAKAKFEEYRDAIRARREGELRAVSARLEAEDEMVMKGYREIARGKAVINIRDVLREGGGGGVGR